MLSGLFYISYPVAGNRMQIHFVTIYQLINVTTSFMYLYISKYNENPCAHNSLHM